jgi:protein involved in polysaccharide export with SLBB domain
MWLMLLVTTLHAQLGTTSSGNQLNMEGLGSGSRPAGGAQVPGMDGALGPALVPAAVDPGSYLVGPGDGFRLILSGRVSRVALLSVGPEGTFFVPGVGIIDVGGLSLEEVRETVTKRIASGLRGVNVQIELVQVRVLRIYLTGEVTRPGAIQVTATSRVSDAATAEEILPTGSTRNVRVTRRDGERVYADLALFRRSGRLDLNPYLHDGDIVHVPPAVDFIEVRGAVAQPDRYELGPSDSLRTLLELAGGPLPATLTDQCLLVQWKSPTDADSVFFNLLDVYSGAYNPPIREGDRAYVYFTPAYHEMHQASILGEVNRPGTYPIDLGVTRLSDLVESAGGFRERADLATVHLIREGGYESEADPELERLLRLSRREMTNAEYEVMRTRQAARRSDYRVGWQRLKENPKLNMLMVDGDIVRVDPIYASVRVEGEVQRPGLVEFDSTFTIENYISMVGGYSNRADKRKVLITRSVTGQTLPRANVDEVAPGDMIWVPEKPDQTFWDHLQTFITVSAQLATIAIAIVAVVNTQP